MRIETFFLLVLCAAAAFAIESSKDSDSELPNARSPGYVDVYSSFNRGGHSRRFTQYVPSLGAYNWANSIASVCVRGLWFFYQHNNYNKNFGGHVVWTHGIDFCSNLNTFAHQANSLRFGGSPRYLNEDSITFYEGTGFTGSEFWTRKSSPTLRYLDRRASSLLVTGTLPWTLYSGINYSGHRVCVYPNTDHDASGGIRMDMGMFPSITQVRVPENSVRSVRRGCFASNVVHAAPLQASHTTDKGSMGVLEF